MGFTSKVKQIIQTGWEKYETVYGKIIRQAEKEAVSKVLGCGDPKNGYAEYWCLECNGAEKKIVPFTCKSRFCPSCGKVYTDNWVEKMVNEMVDVPHRHVVLTIAEELRPYFYWHRDAIDILIKSAAQVLKSIIAEKKKKLKLTPGIIIVVHTFGGDLKFNPHIQALVTEGGLDKNGDWQPVTYFSYQALRRRWQHLVLKNFKQRFGSQQKIKNLINKLYAQKKKGFYVYGKNRIRDSRGAAKYIGRYMARPAIAESRIISWDSEKVEFWYESKETGKKETVVLPIMQFIGRIISHIPEKQFKMVRHYGIYARNQRKESRIAVKLWQVAETLKRRKIHGYKEVAKKKSRKLTYRELMMKEYGRDPCKCPKCGSEMELVKIWHPVYGDIYDLFETGVVEVINSGKKQKSPKNKKEKEKTISKNGTDDNILLFAM
ncbi:IS91 family transposase [Desulfoscipio geothermicus]|uniref:Transposase zinc-binding domain-containing protein n=1 Tax=Desulfoscipio geothermicus DSM 3669 TaxID=1121426 RepID=A0A1I6ELJ5_9FIRM|nr:IS91 family transposase [Desulfoscipio geothermicus]SFR18646.1 Transposase zinc-binding domain-containing protein [Desulfoscipio geothermicus DSM 3669]